MNNEIDLTRINEIRAKGFLRLADTIEKTMRYYCDKNLKNYESTFSFVSSWNDQYVETFEYLTSAKIHSDNAAIFPIVSVVRGGSEGYRCNVTLCVNEWPGGIRGIGVATGKFWSLEEAQELQKYLTEEVFCW